MKKRKLGVFIDESGDLGEYNEITEFYVISFVFHDQSNDISGQIERLNNSLKQYSIDQFAIHTEPLIRREEVYENMNPKDRRNIFTKLFFFSMSSSVMHKTFVFSKKFFKDPTTLLKHINRELYDYFSTMKEYFTKYDEVVVYYDNGQMPIKNRIETIFSLLLDNYKLRKVLPVDYKLFQTADMLCTLYLIDAKFNNHPISNSEKCIFNSKYDFYHDFFNPISEKELEK